MLDEGQGGIVTFCLGAPREVSLQRSCSGADIPVGNAPASQHHAGWRYLGMFVETQDGSGAAWRDWLEAREPDLPEPQ